MSDKINTDTVSPIEAREKALGHWMRDLHEREQKLTLAKNVYVDREVALKAEVKARDHDIERLRREISAYIEMVSWNETEIEELNRKLKAVTKLVAKKPKPKPARRVWLYSAWAA